MELKLTYLIRSSFMWIARREREESTTAKMLSLARGDARLYNFHFVRFLRNSRYHLEHLVTCRYRSLITFSWNSL